MNAVPTITSTNNQDDKSPHSHQGGDQKDQRLRRGWTTGACATAAMAAAYQGLITGEIPQQVNVTLGRSITHDFSIHDHDLQENHAIASVIKDAGDDPDVTHGAEICVKLSVLEDPSNHILNDDIPHVTFKAGSGVGTVTKEGLPIGVGEPAINPAPREMMINNIHRLSDVYQKAGLEIPKSLSIEISIPHGQELAEKTWNGRLGILGGLSILGTTGVVIPYSCSAWIHSIYRGIDVIRAENNKGNAIIKSAIKAGAATGKTSENFLMTNQGLNQERIIDMGDFAGAMCKYLIKHPLNHLVIAGGFAKLSKLAQGQRDLHSSRSQLDINALVDFIILHIPQDLWFRKFTPPEPTPLEFRDRLLKLETGGQLLEKLRQAYPEMVPVIGQIIARKARDQMLEWADCQTTHMTIEVILLDRKGVKVGASGI